MYKQKPAFFIVVIFLAAFFTTIQAKENLQPLAPLLEYLTQVAEDYKINSNHPVPIVGIGGCPGVGKTYLTQNLLLQLREKGISCTVIPLDHFNLSPQDRKKIGTEWDIRHFKATELHNCLTSIFSGEKHVKKPTCNQLTGEIGTEFIDLNNIDLILFDGLYALCSESPLHFFDYCFMGIFLEANESDIYSWKWEREQKKAQPRTQEQFVQHMEALLLEYHQNIEYSKKNAFYIIKKDSSHNYQLEIQDTNKLKPSVLKAA